MSAGFDGKLKSWNDDRGFGFIAPVQGGQEIFVHHSAFPRDGRRPALNEALSFEVELNPEGKKRAVHVRWVGREYRTDMHRAESHRRPERIRAGASGSRRGVRLIGILLLASLGVWGYAKYSSRVDFYRQAEVSGTPLMSPQNAKFSCDGRTHCSQMTSCAEATFFLKSCPGVQMDGNHDGVPCEQQWCTSPFAK
ncbi:MAG: cold shock domain-containing protein [Polaromonas sp.]|uniref:cold shock domain-containing protein n=1 Tax=Polaromonas sp. TaxID=1869339 RepID=UPI002734EB6D|nr:cold shock domain-containing protein [Polaromonas sp.]MDP3799699.1 cold shock domain-containing protein [Polaromonas sp.]